MVVSSSWILLALGVLVAKVLLSLVVRTAARWGLVVLIRNLLVWLRRRRSLVAQPLIEGEDDSGREED